MPIHTIRGPFDVSMSLLPVTDKLGGIGRFALDKRYHGPLSGTAVGEMLAWRSAVDGSAGYVAMERVAAELDARRGHFTLQHSGHMQQGTRTLEIHVVADSGDGQLTGLSGTMQIEIAPDGAHTYVFRYSLPDTGALED